ncbi:MAG: hypothetical protein M0R03_23670, partial [Novosphingobium sp.]|nr:hypothetical protein [Novosphingobium sp.]
AYKNLNGNKYEKKKNVHYVQNYNQFERNFKTSILRSLIRKPEDTITFKFYSYVTGDFIKTETI